MFDLLEAVGVGDTGQPVRPFTDQHRRLWVWACRSAKDAASGERTAWTSLNHPGLVEAKIWADTSKGIWQDLLSMAERCHLLREVAGDPWLPRPTWENKPVRGIQGGTWLIYGKPRWVTPQVESLAMAAAESRSRGCLRCDGSGQIPVATPDSVNPCESCRGAAVDGDLLLVLSDAIEESGCPAQMADVADQCPVCRGRGFTDKPCRSEPLAWARDGWPIVNAPTLTHRVSCSLCQQTGQIRTRRDIGVLSHLREAGPHPAGCWALRCVLGEAL